MQSFLKERRVKEELLLMDGLAMNGLAMDGLPFLRFSHSLVIVLKKL
jgi:hypothetical protein